MFRFISENLSTIITGVIVFTIVAAVVVKMMRDRKNNRSSCGCGCSGCPAAGRCSHDQ